jgi:hypothetical protein
MGVKHDKMEKKQGKGQTKGKKLQQYYFTDCINYYGHICNIRATPQILKFKPVKCNEHTNSNFSDLIHP